MTYGGFFFLFFSLLL